MIDKMSDERPWCKANTQGDCPENTDVDDCEVCMREYCDRLKAENAELDKRCEMLEQVGSNIRIAELEAELKKSRHNTMMHVEELAKTQAEVERAKGVITHLEEIGEKAVDRFAKAEREVLNLKAEVEHFRQGNDMGNAEIRKLRAEVERKDKQIKDCMYCAQCSEFNPPCKPRDKPDQPKPSDEPIDGCVPWKSPKPSEDKHCLTCRYNLQGTSHCLVCNPRSMAFLEWKPKHPSETGKADKCPICGNELSHDDDRWCWHCNYNKPKPSEDAPEGKEG